MTPSEERLSGAEPTLTGVALHGVKERTLLDGIVSASGDGSDKRSARFSSPFARGRHGAVLCAIGSVVF